MGTEGSGASRAGGSDIHNEDAFLVEEGLGLYIVCDGASGLPAGEVAARIAVEALEAFFARAESEFGEDFWRGDETTRIVERALHFALRAVLSAAETDPELRGMATTVTMLLAHERRGLVGHSGDSRAHLVRNRRLHQLTVDHEWTEPVANGGDATPATGAPIEAFAIELVPGDTFILCSDGAEEVVPEVAIIRAAESHSPPLLASRIVSEAHRRNPQVDATAVVVRVRREAEPGWLELSKPSRSATFGHTLAYAQST